MGDLEDDYAAAPIQLLFPLDYDRVGVIGRMNYLYLKLFSGDVINHSLDT